MKYSIGERLSKRGCPVGGFSLVEVMIASAVAASVMGAAALAFSAIGKNQRRLSNYAAIEIGAAAANNYYNLSGVSVDCYDAPNYGRAASADLLRERFWEDISHGSAVYCLARSGLNTVRPVYIPAPEDGRSLDSPEAFRMHLASVFSQSASVYKGWRGSSPYDNGSVYILQPSSFSGFLSVRAIYDIDIQSTAQPSGTYVSVKRYAWNELTDYYDVFFPDGVNGVPFRPLFVFHERRSRSGLEEGAIDQYKTAAGMPFYFIWWPDPAAPTLANQGAGADSGYAASIPEGAANPLPAYAAMAGRTNYFFTVALFPSL
jgi:prepilin-type N-terminal cleavage/methylation domain-containing protein